ncbi:hypothetical protein [Deinococcus frigens]|uniref:hypothetical protein n=1 Tax=Deinococcus frigens TaxID=249403 RepID=UPI000495D79F|nr:hypothetical protein [Deinococcus frigens]
MFVFFILLAAAAFIAVLVFAVQDLRQRKKTSGRTGLAFIAGLVFVGLGTLTAPAPTWDASAAQQVAALMAGEGLDCIPASTGKSCGGTVDGIGSVGLGLSDNRVTMTISDPRITARQLSPELEEVPRQNVQITQGPLAGYYVARADTNTSAQFTLRNEAAHQMYGN